MAGHLASLGTADYRFEQIREAVVRGTVMASFTCEAFSTRRLEELSKSDILGRLEMFREMSWLVTDPPRGSGDAFGAPGNRPGQGPPFPICGGNFERTAFWGIRGRRSQSL